MNCSLLLVDDDSSCLSAVAEYFSNLGYLVTKAKELEEAEALIIIFDYSLVIVDLSLTSLCADEGLRLIDLVQERSPRTKIILMSGRVSPEVRKEALNRGAHAVLGKPQHLPDVAQLVAQLLEVPSGHVT